MITLLFIISFIFCTAITTTAILISYNLLTNYSNQFLRSYFYYLISFYAFAYYGIWAQLLVMFGLSRLTLDSTEFSTLAGFLPILGVPFLFISWIMLIKMSAQMVNKTISLKEEVYIHGFVIAIGITMLSLVYIYEPETHLPLRTAIPVSPLSILLVLEAIYFMIYLVRISRHQEPNRLIRQFNLLLIFGLISRIILFALSILFEIALPLTIPLYFLSNLIPLLFLWRSSEEILLPIQSEGTESSAIDQITERYGITKREKEIVEQIALGKTNQQIADELFISLQTVKDHTHRIYKKTGVNSRLKLITLISQ